MVGWIKLLGCVCAGLCVFLVVAAVDNRAGPVPHPLSAPKCWHPRTRALHLSNDTNANDSPLTIVSITAGLDAKYSRCMNSNRRAYAQRHGYTYCEFDTSLVANRGYGFHKLVA